VLVVGSLATIVSCGSSSKSALVYLASQGTVPGKIFTYRVDLKKGTLSSDNGALNATGTAVDTGTQPTVMIFDPTNTFAFVADLGSPLDTGSDNSKKNGDVAVFSIGKDGALASVGVTPPPVADCLSASPVALAMDRQGTVLFVANQTFYNVNNGATCPGNPSNGTPGPGFITAYPVSSGVLGTPVTAAIPVPAGPPGTNLPHPSAVAVANGLNFVYVTDEVNDTVAGFAFDSTGALSSVPGQFYKVGTTPRALLSPSVGTFLYVANAGSDDIFELFINADGSLMPITNSTTTIPAGVGPIAMLTDPNAKYLLALANGGSQITSFTINRVTGSLSAVGTNGSNVASTGANPVAFTIRSDGSTSGNFWVFTSNFGANSVSTYALNGSTGTLSALPQLTGPVAPYGIATR
jgi:6-phosphogluconolactonase (cycloisomerase 2 family)